MSYIDTCPICNKCFKHGGFHSSRWKLFCHMSSKGKGHRKQRHELDFPSYYFDIPIYAPMHYYIR